MKKAIVMVFILFVSIGMCFCQESWYYSRLDLPEQLAYDAFYDCLCHLRPQWNCGNMDQSTLKTAYDAVLMDHPEVFWSDGFTYVTRYVDNEVSGHFVEFDYTMDRNGISECNDEILQAVLDLVGNLEIDVPLKSGIDSSYEAVRKVYAFLVGNGTYDELNMDQSMYSVLVNGSGVCASFSKAFQFVMQCLGLQCCTVRGMLKQSLSPNGLSELSSILGHEWNLICIEGQWYHVDVTSGLGVSGDEVDYSFMLCTTEEIEKTHIISNAVEIPLCDDSSLGFHEYNGLVLQKYSRDGVKNSFARCIGLGRTTLEVRFSGFSSLSKAREDLITDQNLFVLLEELGISSGESLNYYIDEDSLVLKVYLNSNILN